MGRLTGQACPQWEGALALRLAGRLPEAERAPLEAHLERCPECRAEAARLAPVSDLVTAGAPPEAGPAVIEPAPSLWAGIEARLGPSGPFATGALGAGSAPAPVLEMAPRRERSRLERRRARATLAAAIGAVAAAAAVLLAVVVPWSGNGANTVPAAVVVPLHGQPGVEASARLVAGQAGTLVHLNERGQPAGTTYRVSMLTADGYSWSAGSYRSAAAVTTVRLRCPVALRRIVGVEVTGSSGSVQLSGVVR